MARIGNIDIRMGVSTGALTKGAKQGQQSLSLLGSGFNKAESASGTFVSALGSAHGGLVKFVAAAAGAAALGGFTKFVVSGVQDLNTLSMTAERAGVSVDALKGFQFAARATGSDVAAATTLIGGLNATLAEAATTDNEATFALRGLGLEARDLIKLRPDDAIGRISDALAAVKNPGERAAVTTKLFGDEGLKLSRVLALGSEGLAKYRAGSVALGGSVNGFDSAKVEQANAAFATLGEAVDGVKTRILIGLVPSVAALSEGLAGLGTGGVGALAALGTSADLTFGVITAGADVIHTVGLGFLAWRAGLTEAASWAVKLFEVIGTGLHLVTGSADVKAGCELLGVFSADLHRLAEEQKKVFDASLIAPPPSERLKKFYDDVAASARKSAEAMKAAAKAPNALGQGLASGGIAQKVREFKQALDDEDATLGRSGSFAKLYDLKKHGASDKQLHEASNHALTNDYKGEVLGRGRQALDSGPQTKQGKFAKIFDDLGVAASLLKAGKITQNDFNASKLGANRELLDLKEQQLGGPTKFAGAVEAGSQEARSAMLQATTGGGAGDAAHQEIEIQRRQLDYLQMIFRATDKNFNNTPPEVKVNAA